MTLEIHTPGEGDALSKLLRTICKLHGFDMGKHNIQGATDLDELVKFARNEMIRNEEWENCISQMMRYTRILSGGNVPFGENEYAQMCCFLLRSRANIDQKVIK
jgi:hypothetical protein